MPQRGWAYRVSGTTGYARWKLEAFDANRSPVAYPGGDNVTSAAWTYQIGTYTVPSGVAYVKLYAEIYLATAATVAKFDDGFLYVGNIETFYFSDAIGSTRAVTNSTGSVCFSADYYPFGQENDYTTSCTPTYKFAGYEFDSETGNYYAMARYYNPLIGRFMSPDPLGGDILNPQSLNRYTYVLNDPEDSTDPLGLYNVFGYQQLMEESWGILRGSAQFGSDWNEFYLLSPQWYTDDGFQTSVVSSSAFSWLNLQAQQLLAYLPLGLGTAGPQIYPAPTPQTPCLPAKFADFFSTEYSPAKSVATQYNVAVTSLLALAAHESGWGTSHMATAQFDPFGATPAEEAKELQEAEGFQGTPYKWGGKTPSGFDCSGYVCYVVQHSINPGYAYSPTSSMASNPGLRVLPPGASHNPGDVELFRGHTGFYDPNQARPSNSLLSAEGSEGNPKPGVARGNPQWFHGAPRWLRPRVPCGH